MTKSTTKDRQATYHTRQLAMGRTGRKVYATPAEHERIKELLEELRK